MAESLQMFGLSNLCSNLSKTRWVLPGFAQNSHQMEANSWGYRMGRSCGCGWLKFSAKLGHEGCERGGDERKKKSRGEREGSRFWGGRDRKEGKEEGVSEITKMPLFYYFFWSQTARYSTPLVYFITWILNLKLITWPFIGYSFPKISKFDSINIELFLGFTT